MKHILILSDTHGLLREEVKALLAQAEVVIHAGDINTPAIVDALRRCGESYIVRGNNDKDWAVDLPHSLTFTVEGVRFFLVHNKKDVPKDLSGVDVVVFGHSHKYEEREENGVLWLNPGSCGRRRFHQEITLCRMEAEDGRFRVEKCLIPHEGA